MIVDIAGFVAISCFISILLTILYYYKFTIKDLERKLSDQKFSYDQGSILLQKEFSDKEQRLKYFYEKAIETARKESVTKSRAVAGGQIAEVFVPYIITNTNPKDYKFLGDPIDFIVFRGAYESRADVPKIDEVIFVEVKTGGARLSKMQRSVRECVEQGRIRFVTLRPDKLLEEDDECRSI